MKSIIMYTLAFISVCTALRGDVYYLKITNFNSEATASNILTNHMHEETNVIMRRREIDSFNYNLYKNGMIVHPLSWPSVYQGRYVRQLLKNDQLYLERHCKFNAENRWVPTRRRLRDFLWNVNTDAIKNTVYVSYAIAKCNTRLRVVPSAELRMVTYAHYSFDMLQIFFIQTGDELAILHTSRDRKWHYVRAKQSRGWIKKSDIAILSKKSIRPFLAQKKLVITGRRVRVYKDSSWHNLVQYTPAQDEIFRDARAADSMYHDHDDVIEKWKWSRSVPENEEYYYLYMGKHIPYAYRDDHFYYIIIPTGKNTYITNYIPVTSDVSEGVLPVTRLNIARQAFKMLGEEYQWGGLNGSTDCSSFFIRLFSCFGIELPKSTKDQIKAMREIPIAYNMKSSSRLKKVKALKPFTSFLYHPGHIMLYIGTVKGKPLVIHNKWKYRTAKNEKVIIGKVVINDVYLGEKSRDRSLLLKATKIGLLCNY
ncbi:SH3 domain-containing protein [Spirochaetota bacterium]